MSELVVDQVLSGPELGFDWGLTDLLILEVGGRTVLYALSRSDSAISEVTIATDGTLIPVGDLSLSGAFLPGAEPMLAEAGGALLLAGMDPVAGQIVSLGATGALGTQETGTGLPVLVAPVSVILGGSDGILSGRVGGGLDLWLDAGAGYALASGLDESDDAYLADVSASAVFAIGGTQFAATASATEHGVSLFQVSGSGNLIVRQAIGVDEFLPLHAPTEVEVVQRLGETLLIVGSSGSSSLTTLAVDDWGVASFADHVLDDSATRFQGVTAMESVTYGDFAYVVAGGADGGVTLFTLLPGGRLVHLTSFVDTDATTLYRLSAVAVTIEGNALQIMGGSAWEAGLTRLSYDLGSLGAVVLGAGGALVGTTGDDQLVGSELSDDIDGGAGDDLILDGAGGDSMRGGSGEDVFLFEADGDVDTIQDFERGVDRLDLSDFDFLYDVSQLDIAPTAGGAVISFADETIIIETSDGGSLTAGDFDNANTLGSDRPAVSDVIQNLTGGPLADVLTGGPGNDRIDGAGGNDHILGGPGLDLLLGGDGADTVDGGDGNDTINGGGAPDTLIGGQGDDLIEGDGGNDVIYGDEMI